MTSPIICGQDLTQNPPHLTQTLPLSNHCGQIYKEGRTLKQRVVLYKHLFPVPTVPLYPPLFLLEWKKYQSLFYDTSGITINLIFVPLLE